MKRVALVAAILMGVLLVANILVSSPGSLVDAARAACVAAGHPAEKLQVTRYVYKGGRFGFGTRGVVDFNVRDGDPTKILRVEMNQPVNLLGWRLNAIKERPLGGEDKKE